MRNRLPIVVATAALVVALLGATGIAEAVQSATVSFATNAGKLRGFAPSKTKKKNTVVVRRANGKIDAGSIPASVRSFGDGKQLPNVNDIPCDQDVVVGTQTVTVAVRSRIWVHGHGALRDDASNKTEFALWLRLRNAGDTATLAVSVSAWDANPGTDTDSVFALSSGGVLLSGADPEAPGATFVASPGSYLLQLVARAGGGAACTPAALPDFGWNQGSGMGYLRLATG